MNAEGISERVDVAGALKDGGGDVSRTGNVAACEGGVVDNAFQELETERTSGGTGMQTVAVEPSGDGEFVDFHLTRAELTTLAWHYLNRYFAERLRAASEFNRLFEGIESGFAWCRFCSIREALCSEHISTQCERYIDLRLNEVEEVECETRLRHALEARHAESTRDGQAAWQEDVSEVKSSNSNGEED